MEEVAEVPQEEAEVAQVWVKTIWTPRKAQSVISKEQSKKLVETDYERYIIKTFFNFVNFAVLIFVVTSEFKIKNTTNKLFQNL